MSKYTITANVSEETICNYCEDHILEVQRGCHCTAMFCCEGRHCQDAIEMYTEEYPETEVWEDYEWKYEPSKKIIELENELDDMIGLAGYFIESIAVNGPEHFLTKWIKENLDNKKASLKKV